MRIWLSVIVSLGLTYCGMSQKGIEQDDDSGKIAQAPRLPPSIVPYSPPIPAVDEQILIYLTDFQKEMLQRGIRVNYDKVAVRIVQTLPNNFNGETYYNPIVEYYEVKVLPNYNRHLIYHELGHALFGLAHSPDSNDIMYWLTSLMPNARPIDETQLNAMAFQIKDTLAGRMPTYGVEDDILIQSSVGVLR